MIAAPSRVPALDGLRGVASLVVVVNHCLMTDPTLAAVAAGTGRAAPGTLAWSLAYTPLHLVWAGTEAVLLFFVLSGFVLTGSAPREGFGWGSYYAQRLPRLYLPVWAALLFAAGSAAVVARGVPTGGSWWVDAHTAPDLPGALRDAVLLGGTGFLDNPLWSLTWEVWFSLALPAYVLLGVASRRRPWLVVPSAAGLLAAMIAGSVFDADALRYLPVFGFGVLLAVHRERVEQAAARLGAVWPWLVVVALLLLASYWVARVSPDVPGIVVSGARALQIVGALLLVVAALCRPPVLRVLERPWVQWLGSRSFSLYLTHDAVVSSTVLLFGGRPPVWLTMLVAVPVALVVAEVFFRVAERPAHRLARRIGRRVAGAAQVRPVA